MAKRYDAIVIGGGHNGLVSAAYLAKAGWSTLVLERRHVLGGAAVTEEVFPGFRFSVSSYVVSLLRPEIIRELDLPRHGLEILPLDGTFTPLDGDYLWRVNDHGRSMREIRRWSATDAEAYEEYGQLMVDMARFIKPILSILPPDPGKVDPREWLPLVGLAKAFRELPERQQAVFVELMTMSAADFLEQWFETDPLKATMSASGIIGTYPGRSLARDRVRAAASLHGRDRRRVPRVGHPEGRHRRHLERDRRRRALPGRGDPDRGPGDARDHRRATARPAWSWRAARRSSAGAVLSSLDAEADLPAAGRAGRAARGLPSERSSATSSAAPPGR